MTNYDVRVRRMVSTIDKKVLGTETIIIILEYYIAYFRIFNVVLKQILSGILSKEA